MKDRSPAAVHALYVEFLRKYGHVNADAVVYATQGSGWSLFFRSGVLPLRVRYMYLAVVNGRLQMWRSPAPNGGIDCIAVLDRPTVTLRPGIWVDLVVIDDQKLIVDRAQRPYMRQVLELAAAPPSAGMVGLPAAWYRNPWAFPGQDEQLRYWDGSQWTEHVYPVADPAISAT
ncbi:MAG: DUF2510 domain-containing protein [Candidatus Nanopelagicales bacterium]|nr:DUF2510 domain-containing protein [Candidatus Nanopelagicales bacterium]